MKLPTIKELKEMALHVVFKVGSLFLGGVTAAFALGMDITHPEHLITACIAGGVLAVLKPSIVWLEKFLPKTTAGKKKKAKKPVSQYLY